MVRFGPLELPGTVGAPLNFVEALVHGIDIAVASGQKIALSDGLAEHALTAAHQVVQDDFRSGGAFGAERVVDDDAEPIERLLGFLGRPTLDG